MLGISPAVSSPYPTAVSMLLSPLFYFASCAGPGNRQVLYPDELALLKGAGEKRIGEFCAGRYCAHRVLDELGYTGLPVLTEENGAPVWPANVVGSISHSGGMALAVAASLTQIRAVGVDIQAHSEPFPAGVIYAHFHREEIHYLMSSLPRLADIHAHAIFSAKESVFKCCYTAFGCLLEFTDIVIEMNLAGGFYYARTPRHPKCERFFNKPGVRGAIGFDSHYIYNAVWLVSGETSVNLEI
jgi:4'-phosphopantetheinyl transferase EntD